MIQLKWAFWRPTTKPRSIKEISEDRFKQYNELLKTIRWDNFGSQPEMQLVYTDLEGHNYYVPKNAYQGITRDRLAAVEAAAMAMETRMKRETFLVNMSEVLIRFERCRAGNDVMLSATEGYQIALDMFNVMKNAPENEVLMQYALHMILTDGEDPTGISPSILKEKRERAEKDPALNAFFLDMAMQSLNDSLPILPQTGQTFSPTEPEAETRKQRTERTAKAISNFISGGKQNVAQ